jgi:cytochrome c556
MTPSRTLLAAAAAGIGLSVIVAASAAGAGNPVEERQATMKLIGQSVKEASAYVTGKEAWDATKVKAVMGGIAANAKKAHGLFPKGSDKDPKSEALPKIWENRADFDKKLDDLANAATTAGKSASVDELKTSFKALGGTCKSCHDEYRAKKS